MIYKILLATCLVIFPPIVILQAYIIKSDNAILSTINQIRKGMTPEEVRMAIGTDEVILNIINISSNVEFARYSTRVYMGVITSRNLVIYFDENKKVTFIGWENT